MLKKFLCLTAIIAFAAACGKDTADDSADANPEFIETIPKPSLPYDVAPYGHNTCTDALFSMEFSSVPVLGTSGKICIYTEGDKLVDEIDMADLGDEDEKMTNSSLFNTSFDALKCGNYYRIVKYRPVKIEGNTLIIKPHNSKLNFDTAYYITVDASAIVAEGFSGITKESGWKFVTKARPSSKSELSVGAEGCDFVTVQGAITHAFNISQTAAVTINVADGVYEELLYIRAKSNLTIKGESRDGVIIRERNSNNLSDGAGSGINTVPNIGSSIISNGGRSIILVESCDKLRFENMTLENTYGDGAQAEVIYCNSNAGSERTVFVNCNFISEQDTICMKGWGWFYNCRIEGDVDFIWGYPQTVLFEECEIVSCDRGYIVQSRCQSASARGFIFLNCELTAAEGVSRVYLARPSGSVGCYDNVTYILCKMDSHIEAVGWDPSRTSIPAMATATLGFKEYGSKTLSGADINLNSRSAAAKTLTAEEVQEIYADRSTIFATSPDGDRWCQL